MCGSVHYEGDGHDVAVKLEDIYLKVQQGVFCKNVGNYISISM